MIRLPLFKPWIRPFVKERNALPATVADAASVNMFKRRPDEHYEDTDEYD